MSLSRGTAGVADEGGPNAERTFALSKPELGLLITFVQDQLYLAPRIGLIHSALVAGGDPMDDNDSDFLSFGGAIGWNFAGTAPFWYSLEMSIMVVDDLADGTADSGTAWYFIPTFGIHTG